MILLVKVSEAAVLVVKKMVDQSLEIHKWPAVELFCNKLLLFYTIQTKDTLIGIDM